MWLRSQAGTSDGCSAARDAAVPQTAIVPTRQRLLMRCGFDVDAMTSSSSSACNLCMIGRNLPRHVSQNPITSSLPAVSVLPPTAPETAFVGRNGLRHCEERSDEAIQLSRRAKKAGLLRFARNDGGLAAASR